MVTLQILQNAGLPALTCDGFDATWSRALTAEEWGVVFDLFHPEFAKQRNARTAALNIPDWVNWTEEQVLDWFATNVDTPLSGTPTNAQVLSAVRSMRTAQKAMARMIVALRDDTWPNLT